MPLNVAANRMNALYRPTRLVYPQFGRAADTSAAQRILAPRSRCPKSASNS
ncbi:hypothetical protein [Deinococcus hopiensis]|uniref:hypothetical protein n=1 Tax=Deinococcus hopiensis TaxID=309885 RepID=UPI001482D69B|nr:hypothetical protein [Deinococcus hopiensis]